MRRPLDQRAHPGQDPPSGAGHPLAEQVDLPAGGQHEAEQHADGRGLARPVGAEEAVDVTRATSRSMPSTARSRPYCLTSPRVLMTAVIAPAPGRAAAPPPRRARRASRYRSARTAPGPAARRSSAPTGPAATRVPSSSTTASGLAGQGAAQPVGQPGRHRRDRQQGDAAAVEPDPRRHAVQPRRGSPTSSAGRATAGSADPPRARPPPRVPRRTAAPNGGVKAVTSGPGTARSRSRNLVSSAGRSAPFSTTSTCSGRPVPASTQTSARLTEAASAAGVSRTPRASRPATRRAPIRDSSPSAASERSRRPSDVGSRSGGAGSSSGLAAVRVAVAFSYSHVQAAPAPGACWSPRPA